MNNTEEFINHFPYVQIINVFMFGICIYGRCLIL